MWHHLAVCPLVNLKLRKLERQPEKHGTTIPSVTHQQVIEENLHDCFWDNKKGNWCCWGGKHIVPEWEKLERWNVLGMRNPRVHSQCAVLHLRSSLALPELAEWMKQCLRHLTLHSSTRGVGGREGAGLLNIGIIVNLACVVPQI